MKSQEFVLKRYDADEGMVFDWKEPRFNTVMENNEEKQIEAHLYARTLFIGVGDSIENYIEVKAPVEEA